MLLTVSQLMMEASTHNCTENIPQKPLHIVVGITCVLSMIGALLIILSYIVIPNIRSKAREILVNLSLMDFMAAGANFAGIAINFEHYLGENAPFSNSSHHHHIYNLCIAQASFALYGTVSSVIWTLCIAVYIYIRIMVGKEKIAYRAVIVFYFLAYGCPLLITVWFITGKKLGYDMFSGSGWCSVLVRGGPYSMFFANDLWIYLTMFLIPIIFIALYCHLKNDVNQNRTILTQNWKATVQSVEVKLIFIPLLFILLRIWSSVFQMITTYHNTHLDCHATIFFLFTCGIGDSGQGFANGILYVFLTHKVRHYFISCFLCRRGSAFSSLSLHSERRAPYGSFSSDAEKREFSNDFTDDSGSIPDKDPKSLLLNT